MFSNEISVVTRSEITGSRCTVVLPSWVQSLAEAILFMREAHQRVVPSPLEDERAEGDVKGDAEEEEERGGPRQTEGGDQQSRVHFHPQIEWLEDAESGAPILSVKELSHVQEVVLHTSKRPWHAPPITTRRIGQQQHSVNVSTLNPADPNELDSSSHFSTSHNASAYTTRSAKGDLSTRLPHYHASEGEGEALLLKLDLWPLGMTVREMIFRSRQLRQHILKKHGSALPKEVLDEDEEVVSEGNTELPQHRVVMSPDRDVVASALSTLPPLISPTLDASAAVVSKQENAESEASMERPRVAKHLMSPSPVPSMRSSAAATALIVVQSSDADDHHQQQPHHDDDADGLNKQGSGEDRFESLSADEFDPDEDGEDLIESAPEDAAVAVANPLDARFHVMAAVSHDVSPLNKEPPALRQQDQAMMSLVRSSTSPNSERERSYSPRENGVNELGEATKGTMDNPPIGRTSSVSSSTSLAASPQPAAKPSSPSRPPPPPPPTSVSSLASRPVEPVGIATAMHSEDATDVSSQVSLRSVVGVAPPLPSSPSPTKSKQHQIQDGVTPRPTSMLYSALPLPSIRVGPAERSLRKQRMQQWVSLEWSLPSSPPPLQYLFRDVIAEALSKSIAVKGAYSPMRMVVCGPIGSGVRTTALLALFDGELAVEQPNEQSIEGHHTTSSCLDFLPVPVSLDAIRCEGEMDHAKQFYSEWMTRVFCSLAHAVDMPEDGCADVVRWILRSDKMGTESLQLLQRAHDAVTTSLQATCSSMSSKDARTVATHFFTRVEWVTREIRFCDEDETIDEAAMLHGLMLLPLYAARLFGFDSIVYCVDGPHVPCSRSLSSPPAQALWESRVAAILLSSGASRDVSEHTHVVYCHHGWSKTTSESTDNEWDDTTSWSPVWSSLLRQQVHTLNTIHLVDQDTSVRRYGLPSMVHVVSRQDGEEVTSYPIDVFFGAPGYLSILYQHASSHAVDNRGINNNEEGGYITLRDEEAAAVMKELAALGELLGLTTTTT